MADKLSRQLELADLYFMGLGGQAPLLSILTFATAVLIYALSFAPIAIAIGTLIVLLNGYVVYKLSARFSEPGGYYVYAFSSLSKRLGFETGWLYLFYSVLYGSAYLVGGAFLIAYMVHIPVAFSLLLVLAAASLFVIFGIKPSAKYAVFAASLEVLFLVLIAVFGIKAAGFKMYNPVAAVPGLGSVALAILFAIGIPTGYGTLTPLSGEAKKPRHIGVAVIGVILIGGALAAFAVYGLSDALLSLHETNLLSTEFPALYVIKQMLGPYAILLLLLAVFNDSVLGVLAFMTASSRTIFAMASKGHLHNSLAELRSGKPMNAAALSILAYACLGLVALSPAGAFNTFMSFAIVSALGGLFVHLAADTSLIRLSFGRRPMYISMAAALASLAQLALGIMFASPVLVYAFFVWIIIGFFYLEVIDFVSRRRRRRKFQK